jgi:hypothetical protein
MEIRVRNHLTSVDTSDLLMASLSRIDGLFWSCRLPFAIHGGAMQIRE